MNMKRTARGLVAATLTAAAIAAVPAYAHHSFSIFDASQTKTFTGVVTRVNPDANHLQIFFAPMNEARTNVERGAGTKGVEGRHDFNPRRVGLPAQRLSEG